MRVVFAFAALALVGCGGPKIEPVIESSAHEAAYSATYPTELHAVSASIGDKQNQVRKVLGTFKDFSGKLKDPAWPRVVEVYRAADAAGRSRAYVDRQQRVDGAHTFFDTERDELARKVGGSAQYVVKKKSCDVEVAGVVAGAMKDGVEKQLEKEMRDVSEPHVLIDRYRAALKKENVNELEKQADVIELASFTVHVDLVNSKLKLRRMLEEAEEVKHEQGDFIEAERKWQTEKGITDADKKESEERISVMKKGQAEVEAQVTQAKALEPRLEDEIAAIQKQYDDAIADLEARARK